MSYEQIAEVNVKGTKLSLWSNGTKVYVGVNLETGEYLCRATEYQEVFEIFRGWARSHGYDL